MGVGGVVPKENEKISKSPLGFPQGKFWRLKLRIRHSIEKNQTMTMMTPSKDFLRNKQLMN